MGWWLFFILILISVIMGPLSGYLTKRRTPGGVLGGMYMSLVGGNLGVVIAHKAGVEDQIGGYGWCWLGGLIGAVVIPLLWSLLGQKEEKEEIIEMEKLEETVDKEKSKEGEK